jgi:hypothetical protein
MLENGQCQRQGGALTRVKLAEASRQRVISLRTDPIQQAPALGRRGDSTDAAVDLGRRQCAGGSGGPPRLRCFDWVSPPRIVVLNHFQR